MKNHLRTIFCTFLMAISCIASAESDVKSLLEEAKNGSKSSLYNLGVIYSEGDGVKQDYEIANQYFEEAAKKNYAPAQNNLGWAYRQGLGIKKDAYQAIYWFRLAGLQHDALALQNLAEMALMGEGFEKNIDLAEEFYLLCALQIISDHKDDRASGTNNAISECRKELAKLNFLRAEKEQEALKMSYFWYRISIVDHKELKEDSEVGVKARRVLRDTVSRLKTIEPRLTADSKKWVEESIANWSEIRVVMLDRASFPITTIDCQDGLTKL